MSDRKMICYVCDASDFLLRKGSVRDNPEMTVLECAVCGLVCLDSATHIDASFYENSGMHGEAPAPMDDWLRDTEWDDQRRFEMMKSSLPNKRLLDFGCGAGGFLLKARTLARESVGIELEGRVRKHWSGQLDIVAGVEEAEGVFDLITAFHVVEHLPDPREMLTRLSGKLAPGGRMVIEVPNSDDALLSLYDCDPFQRFTYWSQHLFLFNAATLKRLAVQAGLRVKAIEHVQRYPLSNHLHWLSKGKPGGHQRWAFLDSPEMTQAYAGTLAALGQTDTLIAHLELNN